MNNFRNELTKEGLGGKIVEEIEVCGYIYLSRIISWIYFLENALKMIEIILKDFLKYITQIMVKIILCLK